jgi:hypothetical protein
MRERQGTGVAPSQQAAQKCYGGAINAEVTPGRGRGGHRGRGRGRRMCVFTNKKAFRKRQNPPGFQPLFLGNAAGFRGFLQWSMRDDRGFWGFCRGFVWVCMRLWVIFPFHPGQAWCFAGDHACCSGKKRPSGRGKWLVLRGYFVDFGRFFVEISWRAGGWFGRESSACENREPMFLGGGGRGRKGGAFEQGERGESEAPCGAAGSDDSWRGISFCGIPPFAL